MNLLRREATATDLAFLEDGLPDIPVTDPATIPPDQGDVDAALSLAVGQGAAGPPPLRLTPRQRVEARNIILLGARHMLGHIEEIHYTQGSARWQGIDKKLRVVKGQFPHFADCSAMSTWMLWNGLTHAKRDLTIEDVVNAQRWLAGYTGTMRQHGRRVTGHLIVGDEVHYGSGTGKHVAEYIGGGYVFSFGSESGPYKLPIHYRGDYDHSRRVIRAI